SAAGKAQCKWLLISLVISNIETCGFLKISFSFGSALIMVRFALSCRSCFLMYSQTFLVTSVRGIGLSPMTAASEALGVIAFMNAAFGVRFLAATFLAGAFLAAAFFAGAFFAAFFAVAMLILSIK